MEKSYQSFSTVGSVLLVLSIVLLTNTVFADDLQAINDKLAIAAVIAQYSYTWDSKDAEAFSNLFTEDAVSEVWLPNMSKPWSRTDTRQNILTKAKEAHTTRLANLQTRHHQSALIFLELSENSARTQNMVLITHQAKSDKAPVLKYSGIYKDEWRKTSQGWRLLHRALYLDPIIQ